jgi:high-affinity iron transporter
MKMTTDCATNISRKTSGNTARLRGSKVAIFALLILVVANISPMFSRADTPYENWTQIADDMIVILEDAEATYLAGDAQGGKTKVDDAYYGYYEKYGLEKNTMAYISGERAAEVEYEFSFAKKAMLAGDDAGVHTAIGNLCDFLSADAKALDGTEESPQATFIASLLIITREGFEAILIVGAIVAYLVKSGNRSKTKPVYIGSLIALVASVGMAFLLNALAGAEGGQNQEIIEGVTMLIAVAVLFYVSNWMVSKSETEAWTRYIEGKVQSSITSGSVFSLAFAAFLAVFREGAETILFYQALAASTETYKNMVWIGLAVGAVLLVGIYLLIRFASIRIPLKPFFLGTSILMFIMSISFIGAGIKELQEGNLIGATAVPGVPTVDILGIYPVAETLIPQVALLVITVALFIFHLRKNKRLREAAAAEIDAKEGGASS